MESVKLHQETRDIDPTYFWILLTVNLLGHFLLWMSGTPFIYPEEDISGNPKGGPQEVIRRDRKWYHVWHYHPAIHYATGGFGKFFFLLIVLDIYYYGGIMRDEWYEVIRILVMDATLVVGVFILNSHNTYTTRRLIITIVGITLFVYNIVMILRSFYLLTHSINHHHDLTKPLIPLDGPIDSPTTHPFHPHAGGHYYRGYEHTRVYDMVLYTSLLLFFSILLKIREKVLYPDHDVLGWNNRIDARSNDPERARLIQREKVVVNANPLEA